MPEKRVIVEVPDWYGDEDCDRVEMKVTEWLAGAKPVLVLRGLRAHVFDLGPGQGASAACKPVNDQTQGQSTP